MKKINLVSTIAIVPLILGGCLANNDTENKSTTTGNIINSPVNNEIIMENAMVYGTKKYALTGQVWKHDTKKLLEDGLVVLNSTSNTTINRYSVPIKNGFFNLSNIPSGIYNIEISDSKKMYKTFFETIKINSNKSIKITLEKIIEKSYPVKGKLVDAVTNQVIKNGIVVLKSTIQDPKKNTDISFLEIVTNGTFNFKNVPAGEYSLEVRDHTVIYAVIIYQKMVVIDSDRELVIPIEKEKISKSYTVEGNLVDSASNQVIQEGVIAITSTSPDLKKNNFLEIITKGAFYFKNVPAGEYLVEASDTNNNYNQYSKKVVIDSNKKLVIPIEKISKSYTVEGNLVDSASKQVIQEGVIAITNTSPDFKGTNFLEIITKGAFYFKNVPSGEYLVEASDTNNNYNQYRKKIVIDGNKKLEISLDATLTNVSGLVKVVGSQVYILENAGSKSEVSYEVLGNFIEKIALLNGKIITVSSKVTGTISEYSKKIEVLNIIKVEESTLLTNISGLVEVNGSVVTIVENWDSKARVSYEVMGDYIGKLTALKGKIVSVSGLKATPNDPWYSFKKTIEVKTILEVK